MDERKHLILIHEENRTKDIQSCRYNSQTHRYDITFFNGGTYSYGYSTVLWYQNPQALAPELYQIKRNGRTFSNIQSIFSFHGNKEYWHIVFFDGTGRTYLRSDIDVSETCLDMVESKNCLSYLRALASINDLKNDNGELLLKKQYDGITFVGKDSAMAIYLNPEAHLIHEYFCNTVIFPFGGNASQFKAVRNALEKQISVIQGPPGTGKTQTILNIIANLLLRNQTVEIVSNNNSAITNVLEKLSAPQYGLDFLTALLGKSDNKEAFISNQSGYYPDIFSWEKSAETLLHLQQSIDALSHELIEHFNKQERLACARQELAALELEIQYFEQYCLESGQIEPRRTPSQNLKSTKVLDILQEYESGLERRQMIPIWYKMKTVFFYRLFEWKYFQNNISIVFTYLLKLFYVTKRKELAREIKMLQDFLIAADTDKKMDKLTKYSLEYLRAEIFKRYGRKNKRRRFSADDLWKAPDKVLKEYPIVLSTTFSSRSSLKNITYDYIIMDEASQVDLSTGALALMCAKNAVVVGDLKQLPNVVSDNVRKQSDAIFDSYQLPKGYSYSHNSFLKSIISVIPDVPKTLLREHYRCHPKIIGFCNQKFYNNELIIMTEDHGEPDALSVYRTTVGNHLRDHVNQRQIDMTIKEILPVVADIPSANIGMIAPYRQHVNVMTKFLDRSNIEVDTVHKFQGREKDVIILSTVDDKVTDFSDDPYLLNVAISRARKKLCLVVSGNEQPKDSNIQDLISYIQYNNFAVIDSQVYSIFDLLYQPYTIQRMEFLSKHKKISEYDSENVMYAALTDLLEQHSDVPLNVICHQSLRLLIRDMDKLTDEECQYVSHPCTHVDFLIYNRISKAPVVAIEVDGFHYHKQGTIQAKRDNLKDSVFRKYKIPLLRFPTNGSGEIEKIEYFLFGEEN